MRERVWPDCRESHRKSGYELQHHEEIFGVKKLPILIEIGGNKTGSMGEEEATEDENVIEEGFVIVETLS